MAKNPSRRNFLGQSAAMVGGLSLARPLSGAAEALREPSPQPSPPNGGGKRPMPIIDTHVHLWNLDKFRLPWIGEKSPLRNNFSFADYQAAVADCGPVQAIYMEVDVALEHRQAEADYVVGLCEAKDSSMVGAVISARPAEDGFAESIAAYRGHKYVKGFRRVLHGGLPGGASGERLLKNLQLLGESDLSFDLCMHAADLPDAVKIARVATDTRFILDHCGNPGPVVKDKAREAWRRNFGELAKLKNVVCKVSGFISNGDRPWTTDEVATIVDAAFEEFGPDQVIFGGDWPVCTKAVTLKRWIEVVKEVIAARPMEEQQKLLYQNAAKFYRLPSA